MVWKAKKTPLQADSQIRFECADCGKVRYYSKSHAKRMNMPYRCMSCVQRGNTHKKDFVAKTRGG